MPFFNSIAAASISFDPYRLGLHSQLLGLPPATLQKLVHVVFHVHFCEDHAADGTNVGAKFMCCTGCPPRDDVRSTEKHSCDE